MNLLIKSVENRQSYGPREKRLLPYIEHIEKEIQRQMDEQFLAVIGRKLSLTIAFAHLQVTEHDFYLMRPAQKDALKFCFYTNHDPSLIKEITKN
jgi:hypothetical protein